MIQKLLLLVTILSTCSSFAAKPITADDVEKWADKLFNRSLEERRMSGTAISLVKDGKLLLSKGYGYADLVKQTPMDPNTTGFRIGSNSKTFVATSIAQLISQGIIKNIDEPANKYLKRIQLPLNGEDEITISHLLTHSAGFENPVFHIGSDKNLDLPLSAATIMDYLPEYVNPAGKYISYNNFGTAILGIIVEDITGQTMSDYLKQTIFDPLEMNHTYLNESSQASDDLGVPYGFAPNGDPVEYPNRMVHPFYGVTGGINSSAIDMAKFMIAHLDEGRTAEKPLMSEQTFKLMHRQIRTNHPLSSGFAMIFFTLNWNGTKMFLHGGNWPGSQSAMIMFPQTNTGIFFGLQGGPAEIPVLEGILGSERLQDNEAIKVGTPLSNVGVLAHFAKEFLGEYVPDVNSDFTTSELEDYIGYYQAQSAPFTTFERVLMLLGNSDITVEKSTSTDGLKINGTEPYLEVSEGVFYKQGYSTPLSAFFDSSPVYNFVRDKKGNVEYLSTQVGFDAWKKVGMTETPSFYSTIWGLSLLICLTGLIFIFIKSPQHNSFTKWTPPLIALLLVVMPLSVIVGYKEGNSVVNLLFFGYKLRFTLFVIMANLVALLSFFSLFYTYQAWNNKSWGTGIKGLVIRVHYSILALAAFSLVPVFHFINALFI